MPGALTCTTIPPEGSYFDKRKGRVTHVPETHHAIVCLSPNCEYALHLPNRLSEELEEKRVRHIKDLHFRELLSGDMTIHLDNAWEDFEERTRKIIRGKPVSTKKKGVTRRS